MHLSDKEIWTALHGMIFGAGFLLLFSAGFFAIWNLRTEFLSDTGLNQSIHRLSVVSWTMVLLVWLTVLVGTYWVYPWYRAKAPAVVTGSGLAGYPKYLLMSDSKTADWHEFGMEWKEHIAWLSPMLLTAVAFVVSTNGRRLAGDTRLRRVVLFLYSAAFFSAAVAGVFGALINKMAPVR